MLRIFYAILGGFNLSGGKFGSAVGGVSVQVLN